LFHSYTLKKEAIYSSEQPTDFNLTAHSYIPQERIFHCIGKHLSDSFPIRNGLKQGDALSPLIFNFSLKYVIKELFENQFGDEIGTHQPSVCAHFANPLGVNTDTIKKM
jgi:hypothetical protein